MINTYETSMAPPPVPPRLGRSQPFLIPAPLPSPGYGKPFIRFLAGVVMLNFLLTAGVFFFYFYNGKPVLPANSPIAAGRAGLPTKGQETSSRALAHMIAKHSPHKQKTTPTNIVWDKTFSVHKNTNYYLEGWVTILEPGDYFVYSRVTFSKASAQLPLVSWVKMREANIGDGKIVMKAYCSLNSDHSSNLNPHMCTATQGDILTLETGNQLSVWVQDLSLIDYEEGATTFGMYKL